MANVCDYCRKLCGNETRQNMFDVAGGAHWKLLTPPHRQLLSRRVRQLVAENNIRTTSRYLHGGAELNAPRKWTPPHAAKTLSRTLQYYWVSRLLSFTHSRSALCHTGCELSGSICDIFDNHWAIEWRWMILWKEDWLPEPGPIRRCCVYWVWV